jgi:hypothetical protein
VAAAACSTRSWSFLATGSSSTGPGSTAPTWISARESATREDADVPMGFCNPGRRLVAFLLPGTSTGRPGDCHQERRLLQSSNRFTQVGVRLVPICLHLYPSARPRPLAGVRRSGRPAHSSPMVALDSARCARPTLLVGDGACLSSAPGPAPAGLSCEVRSLASLRRVAVAGLDQLPDVHPDRDVGSWRTDTRWPGACPAHPQCAPAPPSRRTSCASRAPG